MARRTYGFKAHCEIASAMADYCRSHTGDAASAGLHHLGDAIREATKAYWREASGRHSLKRAVTLSSLAAQAEDVPKDIEHAIPISYLIDLVKNHGTATATIVEQLVQTHTCLVQVTKSEHRRLNALYRSGMPLDWSLGSCPFARYHHANIALLCKTSGAAPCQCTSTPP
jgi:hypothetical protein